MVWIVWRCLCAVVAGTAKTRIGPVNGLLDVEVKLFARGDPDIKAIALDRFVNALRVNGKNLLGSLEGRIVQRAAVNRAKDCLFLLSQGTGSPAEERGGKKFYFR